jgi:hypothetical protein
MLQMAKIEFGLPTANEKQRQKKYSAKKRKYGTSANFDF